MYGETFYGRHTAQHQLQWSLISAWSFMQRETYFCYKKFPIRDFSCGDFYPLSKPKGKDTISVGFFLKIDKKNQKKKKTFFKCS